MDASRRSFDDIEGCGGAPPGDPVVAEGRGFGRSGGGRSSGPRRSVGVPLDAGRASKRELTLGLVTATVAAGVGYAVVEVVGASQMNRADAVIVAAVAFQAVLAVGFVVIARANPFTDLRGLSRDDLVRGLVAFLLALFAWTFVVSAIDGGLLARSAAGIAPGLLVAEVVVAVVLAPVLEERLFRGVLLGALRARWGPVVAVLGQAALFGLVRGWAGDVTSRPATVIGFGVVGAALGWMAHATDDLRPVIAGRAMFGAWILAARVLGW